MTRDWTTSRAKLSGTCAAWKLLHRFLWIFKQLPSSAGCGRICNQLVLARPVLTPRLPKRFGSRRRCVRSLGPALQILLQLPFHAIAFFAPMETWAAIAGARSARRRCSKWKLNVSMHHSRRGGAGLQGLIKRRNMVRAPEVFRAGADEKVPQRLKPTTHIRGRNAGLKALLHPGLTSLTNHAGNFAVSACFLPHYF